MGVQAGTRTAVLLPNCAEIIRAYLALMKLGATVVPVVAKTTATEVAYVLGHSASAVLVTDAAGGSLVSSARPALPQLKVVIGIDASPDLQAAGGVPLRQVESGDCSPVTDPGRRAADPLAIMYTSGSTARPKGVLLPESSLGATGQAAAARIGITARDGMFCVLPLFHCGGTHLAWATTIAAGCRLTLAPGFSARGFWPAVRAAQATHVNLVPGMIAILNRAAPALQDRDHSLRVSIGAWLSTRCSCSGSAFNMVMTWSMTETAAMGTMTPPLHHHDDPRVAGWPLADGGAVEIRDPGGGRCAAGQPGEIWCRHPHVMTGYLDDADATRASLVGGWVRSGDLGVLDETGTLFFRGRLKNMIKRLGENVSGDEVEHVLGQHPDVAECLVLGVADPIRTEEVYAVVVADAAAALGVDAVIGWCRQRGLAEWKLPRYVRIQEDELPRLANGKIDRTAVLRSVTAYDVVDRERGVVAGSELVTL